MKLSAIAAFILAMPVVAACAVQPGAPEGNQQLPAVETAPIRTEGYNLYASCMDRCTGACDRSGTGIDPETGLPNNTGPDCTALGDWGGQTSSCDETCKHWLSVPDPKGGHSSGGNVIRRKL